jgi:hypothetical protein
MTKKEFKEKISVHHYGRGRRPENVLAIFFDWKSGEKDGKYFGGYKYCVFARYANAKQKDLFDLLYDFVTGRIEDTPWYVQLIMAMTDEQRFKVPLSSGGLNTMRKVEPIIQKS